MLSSGQNDGGIDPGKRSRAKHSNLVVVVYWKWETASFLLLMTKVGLGFVPRKMEFVLLSKWDAVSWSEKKHEEQKETSLFHKPHNRNFTHLLSVSRPSQSGHGKSASCLICIWKMKRSVHTALPRVQIKTAACSTAQLSGSRQQQTEMTAVPFSPTKLLWRRSVLFRTAAVKLENGAETYWLPQNGCKQRLWTVWFCFRVINAGKSALNEDQACCEVVVARRRPMSYCPPSTPSRTPSAKRRNSLPNGEGVGLRLDYSKLGEVHPSDWAVKMQYKNIEIINFEPKNTTNGVVLNTLIHRHDLVIF